MCTRESAFSSLILSPFGDKRWLTRSLHECVCDPREVEIDTTYEGRIKKASYVAAQLLPRLTGCRLANPERRKKKMSYATASSQREKTSLSIGPAAAAGVAAPAAAVAATASAAGKNQLFLSPDKVFTSFSL